MTMATKYMTQTEYGEHRGITQSRVSRLITSGKITARCIKKMSGKKLIDRDKADKALEENLDRAYNPNPAKKGKPKTPTTKEQKQKTQSAGTSGMTMADAQKLQAQYKAALLKLEYDEKSGELIKAADVQKDAFDIARATRDAILNVPGRLCAELASITVPHVLSEKLTEELTMTLEELSNDSE